jgi:hypothetical protein
MSLLQRIRRAPWLSGAIVLLLIAAILSPLGSRLGSRYWAYGAGLAAFLLLARAGIDRMLKAASSPRPPRARGKLRGLPGRRGRGHDFDLANDDTTDGQRWLM